MEANLIDGKIFEVTSKPWFGPKKRAREKLLNRKDVLPPRSAFVKLCDLLGTLAQHVQGMRFYDYIDSKDGVRYTLALIWTDSHHTVRDRVYELADDWIRESGWYPLPQGERIGSREVVGDFFGKIRWEATIPKFHGDIESVHTNFHENDEGGCSISVSIGGQKLVLDTGFRDKFSPIKETHKLCFLSHIHGDHMGNFHKFNKLQIPVVMSQGTCFLLSRTDRSGVNKKTNTMDFKKNIIAIDSQATLDIGNDLKFNIFPVPHMPGSCGAIVRDQRKAVIFTGDICFRTARHDYIDEFVNLVEGIPTAQKIVLIDATMALREFGASDKETAAKLCNDPNLRSIVFTAKNPEHLFYAYLDIFHEVKNGNNRNNVYFHIHPELRYLFECVHEAFISKKTHDLDPFLLAQYQKTMSSWAESRWLFWNDDRPELNPLNKRFRFIVDYDSSIVEYRDSIHVRIGDSKRNPLLKYVDAQGAWNLHSDQVDLAEVTKKLSKFSRVIFFHNFKNRINDFIRSYGLKAEALTDKPTNLINSLR